MVAKPAGLSSGMVSGSELLRCAFKAQTDQFNWDWEFITL